MNTIKKILAAALALALAKNVTACAIELRKGPYDYPNSIWISETPYIELHVSSNHVIQDSEAFLIADGQKIAVDVFLEADRSPVRIRRKGNEEVLISGTLGSVKENEISFTVEEDYVYSGAYQSITFRRQTE